MDRAVTDPIDGQRAVGASPHRLINPEILGPPLGFTHAVVPAPGRTVFLGGQTGHRSDGTLVGPSLLEQFDQALADGRSIL
jgi:hypothetical protein